MWKCVSGEFEMWRCGNVLAQSWNVEMWKFVCVEFNVKMWKCVSVEFECGDVEMR